MRNNWVLCTTYMETRINLLQNSYNLMYNCEHPEVSQLYCGSTRLHCISEYKNILSHALVKRFAFNSELKLFECSQKLLRIVSGWLTNSF